VFGLGTVTVVAAGWLTRQHEYVSPEFGLGYALGVAGAVLMLTLLLYSARKNLRFMRTWGPVKPWFQVHQLLGIVGPVCILFHANFHLGATNSNVAMACMLVIVASGFVGRFLQGKIQRGLQERRDRLAERRRECALAQDGSGGIRPTARRARQRLLAFEMHALADRPGFVRRAACVGLLGLRARWIYAMVVRDLRTTASASGPRQSRYDGQPVAPDTTGGLVWAYIAAVRSVAEFGVYERLFAVWHLIHVPLFFMLFASSVVHVVAVHAY
jgi:hypothetical protein